VLVQVQALPASASPGAARPWISGPVCHCKLWRFAPSGVRAPRASGFQALSAAANPGAARPWISSTVCHCELWRRASPRVRAPCAPNFRALCATANSDALRLRGFGRRAPLGSRPHAPLRTRPLCVPGYQVQRAGASWGAFAPPRVRAQRNPSLSRTMCY